MLYDEVKKIDKKYCKDVDDVILSIAEYVHNYKITDDHAIEMARKCILDAIGCALQALTHKDCNQFLGAYTHAMKVEYGVRVPGTEYILDPIKAAFDISSSISWLGFNDVVIAKEIYHPSGNIGAILAAADTISQKLEKENSEPLLVENVLEAIVKAYEIQGALAMSNNFRLHGLDEVFLIKIASAAVTSKILGGDIYNTISAISHAFADSQSLPVYRDIDCMSSRQSWAEGDAASRGLQLAWFACFCNDGGIANVLTMPQYGFNKLVLNGEKVKLEQELGTKVIDGVLFRVLYPAELHGQTAIEAAVKIHNDVGYEKAQQIERVEIKTHNIALELLNRPDNIDTPVRKFHSLQYVVASSLLFGTLDSDFYSDEFIEENPNILELMSKVEVVEKKAYSDLYNDLNVRAIPNSLRVFFKTGGSKDVEFKYPLGHKNRREEAEPHLKKKYQKATEAKLIGERAAGISELWFTPMIMFSTIKIVDLMKALSTSSEYEW